MLNLQELSEAERDEVAKLLARAIKDSQHAVLVITFKLPDINALKAALQVRGATLVWVDEDQVFTSEHGWHRGFYQALGWHFPNEYNWAGLDDYLDPGPLMPQHGCVFYFSDFERHRSELDLITGKDKPRRETQEYVLDMLERHGNRITSDKYFCRTLIVWTGNLKMLMCKHPVSVLSWDPVSWTWEQTELPPAQP